MGLAETGVVDEATWEALLSAQSSDDEGEGLAKAGEARGPSPSARTASSSSSSSRSSQKPYQDLFAAALGGKQQQQAQQPGLGPVPGPQQQGSRGPGNGRPASPAVRVVQEVVLTDIVQSTGTGGLQEAVTVHEEVKVVGAGAAGSTARTAWPVLMEGDGGREVHALHVALQQVGERMPSRQALRACGGGQVTAGPRAICASTTREHVAASKLLVVALIWAMSIMA